MKKKIIRRCLAGMPVGVMISVVITIIISLTNGDGKYYMVHPDLVTDCGTEIAAVIIQTLCSMLYGAAFAGASVVWDTDWSLLLRTVCGDLCGDLGGFVFRDEEEDRGI